MEPNNSLDLWPQYFENPGYGPACYTDKKNIIHVVCVFWKCIHSCMSFIAYVYVYRQFVRRYSWANSTCEEELLVNTVGFHPPCECSEITSALGCWHLIACGCFQGKNVSVFVFFPPWKIRNGCTKCWCWKFSSLVIHLSSPQTWKYAEHGSLRGEKGRAEIYLYKHLLETKLLCRPKYFKWVTSSTTGDPSSVLSIAVFQ